MSTRSYIIQEHNGKFTGIYCHWDGYVAHNGKILLEHYPDHKALTETMSKGDMSVLNENPEQCRHYVDMGNKPENVQANKADSIDELISIAENSGCEYVYHFDGGQWLYADRGLQYFGMSDGSSFSEFRSLQKDVEELPDEDDGEGSQGVIVVAAMPVPTGNDA